MTELVRDRVIVHGSPEAVWNVIEDPAVLLRVLPGAETITARGDGTLKGVLASKIQFLTVRADVDAAFHDAVRPRHLRLEMAGRPRGLAGSFLVSVPFDLEPVADGEVDGAATEIRYAVDLQVTGRLAAFGVPLLRDAMRRQVAELVANVEHELLERARADRDGPF